MLGPALLTDMFTVQCVHATIRKIQLTCNGFIKVEICKQNWVGAFYWSFCDLHLDEADLLRHILGHHRRRKEELCQLYGKTKKFYYKNNFVVYPSRKTEVICMEQSTSYKLNISKCYIRSSWGISHLLFKWPKVDTISKLHLDIESLNFFPLALDNCTLPLWYLNGPQRQITNATKTWAALSEAAAFKSIFNLCP